MPSHPDRVRRNYISTEVRVYEDPRSDEHVVNVRVTKARMATWPNDRKGLQFVALDIFNYLSEQLTRPKLEGGR